MTDVPCESRPAARCTYELTTGAPWDRTLNKCFTDADGACRWSDECTRIDGAAACASAKCQWTRLCVPASERISRSEQGNRCVHKCTPPGFRGGRAVAPTAAPPPAWPPTAAPPTATPPGPTAQREPAAASVQADSALASNASYPASYSYSASYSYDCCGGDTPPPPSTPPPPEVVVTLPGGARLRAAPPRWGLRGGHLPRSALRRGAHRRATVGGARPARGLGRGQGLRCGVRVRVKVTVRGLGLGLGI